MNIDVHRRSPNAKLSLPLAPKYVPFFIAQTSSNEYHRKTGINAQLGSN